MNLPNLLSLLRLCMVPVFVLSYFSKMDGSDTVALVVFVLAAITDVLDGMLARKLNKISNLGKVLDPLGDKLMALSALACLTIDRIIPIWAVIVLLGKEVLMCAGGLFVYKRKAFMPPSNYFGKTSTVVSFVAFVILLMFKNVITKPWPTVIISIALAVAMAALINYCVVFARLIKKQEQTEGCGCAECAENADDCDDE